MLCNVTVESVYIAKLKLNIYLISTPQLLATTASVNLNISEYKLDHTVFVFLYLAFFHFLSIEPEELKSVF